MYIYNEHIYVHDPSISHMRALQRVCLVKERGAYFVRRCVGDDSGPNAFCYGASSPHDAVFPWYARTTTHPPRATHGKTTPRGKPASLARALCNFHTVCDTCDTHTQSKSDQRGEKTSA